MSPDEARFERWIDGLRTGDALVLTEFMDQYRPALERLASRRIKPGLQRRVGPETVAQSVCRTFLRRAGEGQFELADGDALWRLLCAIALTKVREKVRYHGRQKRSADREVPIEGVRRETPEVSGPSAEETVAFEEQLEQAVAGFSDEERRIFDFRLQDLTQAEIAEEVGVSERTVRRVLKRLEARMLELLDAA